MVEMTEEILMLAAVVTAYVGVLKAYGVSGQHLHLFSLAVAAVFVLVPDQVQQSLLTISLIGLTASGAYQYARGAVREGGRDDAGPK